MLALGGPARAQGYPSGPVKIIVGVGPGSSADTVCRIIAEQFSHIWGQQAVVINQPGGGGGIGIRAAGNSAPDGLTLYMSLASNYVLLPQTQATFPFNVARDFVPIGFVGSQWVVIAAPPSLGVNTLPELIALAKRKPGELNAEAALRGSILHLSAEWLKRAAGIDLTLLFYPSTPQALTDLIAGRVHVAIESLAGLSGSIKGGTLKALAVMSPQRLPDYPDLPTVAETLPGLVASGWLALMAPPKTPEVIAQKVSADLRTVLARPDVIERMQNLGTYPQPMTPAELASFIASQRQTWQPIIDAVGMVPPK